MQPELFEEIPASRERPRRVQAPLFPSRFVRIRVAYEDLIFGCLAGILLLLGGFCVGVERGRHLVNPPEKRPVPLLALAQEELSLPMKSPTSAPKVSLASSEGTFAIQLASYIGSQAAQMEARRLRQQGLKAEVVAQGKFFELRVSGFASRSEALAQLMILRKTYHDAFIKPVSSRKVFAKKQA